MRIFIAGGTGNMGQNFTKLMLEDGHEVVLLTRTPDRIPGLVNHPQVTFVKGDSHSYDAIREGLKGCDAVVTFALSMKGRSPIDILESETKAVVFLLEAAEQEGVEKFVYTSTVAVMGDSVDETGPFVPWGSIYGATKASAEAYVRGFRDYFAGFLGDQDKKVTMKRNVVRPGETFSDPAFEGGAVESYPLIQNIVRSVYRGEDLTYDINEGSQWAAGKQVAEVFRKVLYSDYNEEIFLAVGSRFLPLAEIALLAKELLPESPSKITVTGEEGPRLIRSMDKVKQCFGLEFRGDEYLRDHIEWIIERLRKEDRGEELYNTNHN